MRRTLATVRCPTMPRHGVEYFEPFLREGSLTLSGRAAGRMHLVQQSRFPVLACLSHRHGHHEHDSFYVSCEEGSCYLLLRYRVLLFEDFFAVPAALRRVKNSKSCSTASDATKENQISQSRQITKSVEVPLLYE
jgi:hypothetical protein